MSKTYELVVRDVSFFIDSENKEEALEKIDNMLSEIASDWSQPEFMD